MKTPNLMTEDSTNQFKQEIEKEAKKKKREAVGY